MINLDKVPSDSNESICPTRPSSFQKEVSDELESLRTLCLEEPVLAQHSIDFSMRHKLTTEEGSAEGPIIPPWTKLFEKNLFEDREHSIAGNFIAATDLLQIKELAETYRTAVTTANAVFDKIKAVLTTDPEQRPDHSEPVIVSTVSASIDPKILSEGEKGKLERELIGNRCAKFLTEEAPTPPQLLAVMRVFRGLPIPGRGGVVPELTRIAADFSTNREMDLPLLFTTLAQWSGQSAEIASQIRERITELFPGSKPVTSLSYEDFLYMGDLVYSLSRVSSQLEYQKDFQQEVSGIRKVVEGILDDIQDGRVTLTRPRPEYDRRDPCGDFCRTITETLVTGVKDPLLHKFLTTAAASEDPEFKRVASRELSRFISLSDSLPRWREELRALIDPNVLDSFSAGFLARVGVTTTQEISGLSMLAVRSRDNQTVGKALTAINTAPIELLREFDQPDESGMGSIGALIEHLTVQLPTLGYGDWQVRHPLAALRERLHG